MPRKMVLYAPGNGSCLINFADYDHQIIKNHEMHYATENNKHENDVGQMWR